MDKQKLAVLSRVFNLDIPRLVYPNDDDKAVKLAEKLGARAVASCIVEMANQYLSHDEYEKAKKQANPAAMTEFLIGELKKKRVDFDNQLANGILEYKVQLLVKLLLKSGMVEREEEAIEKIENASDIELLAVTALETIDPGQVEEMVR